MLVVTDVHRHFEGMHAVDGVSLEVPRGQITGLIGPNGAGKSTFMAVLAGTLPATAGKVVFDGHEVPAAERVRAADRSRELARRRAAPSRGLAAGRAFGPKLLAGRRAPDRRRGARAAQAIWHEREGVRLCRRNERRAEATDRDHAGAHAASALPAPGRAHVGGAPASG